eukprot:7986835-Heterocapsa_arctica.AAC.1
MTTTPQPSGCLPPFGVIWIFFRSMISLLLQAIHQVLCPDLHHQHSSNLCGECRRVVARRLRADAMAHPVR